MDIVGDWSPVVMQGAFRKFLDWWEHPKLRIDPEGAARNNERLNRSLLELVDSLTDTGRTGRPIRQPDAVPQSQ